MKTLHELADLIKAAATAVDGAAAARQETVEAQKATANARAEADQVAKAAAKDKADADSYVEETHKLGDRVAAKVKAEREGHEAAMKKAADDAKTATDAASETLEGINRQIAEGKAELERLMTAKARIRAEITDALKDGE